jgi:hypothetical protein
MKPILPLLLLTATLSAQTVPLPSPGLAQVKRVYVAALSGHSGSDTLRELIIASLDATKLFVLTDDPDRADAILKGAGEGHTFEDSFDAVDSVNTHTAGGKGSGYGKSNGLNLNLGAAEAESHHSKERKHEAFAAVRLCTKDGDVLWSTTQESLGAKFRGAGADVAAKIAKQLTFDMEKARKPVQ